MVGLIMKGYEDIIATLLFLAVVITGGYFYLDNEVKQQNKPKVVTEKVVQTSEPTMFEVVVKRTE